MPTQITVPANDDSVQVASGLTPRPENATLWDMIAITPRTLPRTRPRRHARKLSRTIREVRNTLTAVRSGDLSLQDTASGRGTVRFTFTFAAAH